MNMEIDLSQSSTSTPLNGDRDIVFERFWSDLLAHEVKVSRKILHVCRNRCESFRSKQARDRTFQEYWYSRRDWLCGSVKNNRLFYGPCLLFRSSKSSTWTFSGYTNMHSFAGDCQKHEGPKSRSKSHLEAFKGQGEKKSKGIMKK